MSSEPYPPPERLVACCRHLRTKGQFCRHQDAVAGPGFVRLSPTATYWCDRTGEAFGPDDEPGTPGTCQPGRACYQPAD